MCLLQTKWLGEEVTLESTANEGYEFISWTDGEEVVSENAVYVFTMPTADVTLTANFSEVTSIWQEAQPDQNINVFPNPAQSHISIKDLEPNSTLDIYAITGAKMMRLDNQSGRANLDISGLNNGMYIIKISSEKGVVSKKIFINR